MKTAVSLPDEIFEEAERLAQRLKLSRSELYSRALKEFLARHSPDLVERALNEVCDTVQEEPDAFVKRAALRILEKDSW